MKVNLYRILICLLLTGCSGGNTSSSGSGGASELNSKSERTSISQGGYTGEIKFDQLNEPSRITIKVSDTGDITIVSAGSGIATGNSAGKRFTASGTLRLDLPDQSCSGSASFTGEALGSTLTGTVSAPSALCTQNGVSFILSLDGEFSVYK